MKKPGGGGVRLLALKFVEAVILLYTPDPNGSLKPPPHDGNAISSILSRLCINLKHKCSILIYHY